MPRFVSTQSVHSTAEARIRILEAAREHLFTRGYASLTMDTLAHELGMSKKTLYVHFAGKEAMLAALFDDIGQNLRMRMDAVLTAGDATFTEKLRGVITVAGDLLGRATLGMLRDLQRYAPAIYQRIEAIRQNNIPHVFGRLIRVGMAEGKVRSDIDPDFAAQFWLQAIRGLLQPGALASNQLTTRQTLDQAADLFFSGLLTPAGRKDYEKHK